MCMFWWQNIYLLTLISIQTYLLWNTKKNIFWSKSQCLFVFSKVCRDPMDLYGQNNILWNIFCSKPGQFTKVDIYFILWNTKEHFEKCLSIFLSIRVSVVLDPIDFQCQGRKGFSKYLILCSAEGRKTFIQVWNDKRLIKIFKVNCPFKITLC